MKHSIFWRCTPVPASADGIGYLSRRLAPAVMPGGKVWAVDGQPEMSRVCRSRRC